jgi:hypothetical protein
VSIRSLEVDEVHAMLHGAELEIAPNAVNNIEIIDHCCHEDVVECGRDPSERRRLEPCSNERQ